VLAAVPLARPLLSGTVQRRTIIQEDTFMAKVPRSLAGQVVAITGGARGIGRATAAALIAQGARVAIGDIDAPLAERTATELGAGTIGLPLDVTERASFASFLDQVEGRLGPLDVLINNAGIMPVGPFLEETDACAQRIMEINVNGVIFGSKLALGRFVPRRTGHLVNVSSIAGRAGTAGGATYSASKFAVYGLSESLRAELHGSGVEVSVVMPIGVNTELYSGVPQLRGFKTPEPEDVAEAILSALQRPRFDVYVPKSMGAVIRAGALMPRRGLEAFSRLMGGDALTGADHNMRAAYEARMNLTINGLAEAPPEAAADEAPAEPEREVV
jgi:NAD(P)-dependent dehydrogenase (short-subunit alcohol dehydrogenase family)